MVVTSLLSLANRIRFHFLPIIIHIFSPSAFYTHRFLLFLRYAGSSTYTSTFYTSVPCLSLLSTHLFLLSLSFLHNGFFYCFTFYTLIPSHPALSTCWFLLSQHFQHTGSFSPSAFNTPVPSMILSLRFQHAGSSVPPLCTRQFLVFLCFQHTCFFSPSPFYTPVPSTPPLSMQWIHHLSVTPLLIPSCSLPFSSIFAS
jgi:hypothetical protein